MVPEAFDRVTDHENVGVLSDDDNSSFRSEDSEDNEESDDGDTEDTEFDLLHFYLRHSGRNPK